MNPETVEVADELVDAPAAQIALVGPIEKALVGVKAFVADAGNTVFDIETYAGEQTARQLRLACVKHRTSAKDAYEEANAPFLAAQKRARELVKEIEAIVEPVETSLDAQIKAKEERKKAERLAREAAAAKRAAEIRERMAAISGAILPVATGTALEIQAAYNQLLNAPLNEELFGDFLVEATDLTMRTLYQLRELHGRVDAREKEAAELQRQREELAAEQRRAKAEREAQQKKDREENDRIAAELKKQVDAFEAEKAAAAKLVAEQKAESDARAQAELSKIEQVEQAEEKAEPAASHVEAIRQPADDAQESGPEAPAAYRPDDEEILALIARSFDVSQSEALEWLSHFDADAQAQRLKEIAA